MTYGDHIAGGIKKSSVISENINLNDVKSARLEILLSLDLQTTA